MAAKRSLRDAVHDRRATETVEPVRRRRNTAPTERPASPWRTVAVLCLGVVIGFVTGRFVKIV